MGYEPTTWHGGDVLSAEAMNKIENGIANAGSGALEVGVIIDGNTQTLDKTWQEIYDAFPNVYIFFEENGHPGKANVNSVVYDEGWYIINFDFATDSPNGYPALNNSNSGGTIVT